MAGNIIEELSGLAAGARWADLESLSKRCLSGRKHFLPHLYLIQALIMQGRLHDADVEFDDLVSYKFNLADRLNSFPMVADRYRKKLDKHYVLSTMGDGITFEQISARSDLVRRWNVVAKISSKELFFLQAREMLDSNFSDMADVSNFALKEFASCVTLGSCFAANLAKKFNEKGLDAKCLLIEESVNSTYANKLLLEVASGQVEGKSQREMVSAFGGGFFEGMRASLAACSHVVLTVGVAPSFFDSETDEFVFAGKYGDLLRKGAIYMRTTSVDENKSNLLEILKMLNSLAPNAQVFVTVSPVPLAATTEMKSVLLADCVSKATLRAAVHEIIGLVCEKAIYFPAFEIVRWLSGHSDLNVYGDDDENSRHVSDWVVGFIVEEFERRFLIRR